MDRKKVPSPVHEALRVTRTLLLRTRATVAVAESCTGGLLSALLTSAPGSSAFFLAGLVVYSNDAKTRFLGLRASALRRHGAVSACTAQRMAEEIRAKTGSDFGISITGIAGPAGGTRGKPVGTVYIAFSDGTRTQCSRFRFHGSRARIRWQAVQKSLIILAENALFYRARLTR